MTPEGMLRIILPPTPGGEVVIESSRPVHAARVFHGKPLDQALRLLPMLFSVCGTAQACAGARAAEGALGIAPRPPTEALRERLVAMEMVKEHAWRILLDWPALIDEVADPAVLATVVEGQRRFRLALCGEEDPFVPDARCLPRGGVDSVVGLLRGVLERSIYGGDLTAWLALGTPAELAEWAAGGKGIAARMVRRVIDGGWEGLGRNAVPALPEFPGEVLDSSFDDPDFVARPHWQGGRRESSSLTRVGGPLFDRLARCHGNGLLTRLVGRLTELARALEDASGLGRDGSERFPASIGGGVGIGRAEAARGRLYHRLRLVEGVVADYRILAPTEWNFAPDGVAAAALSTLSGPMRERQARLLINAIDPCVGYQLEVAP